MFRAVRAALKAISDFISEVVGKYSRPSIFLLIGLYVLSGNFLTQIQEFVKGDGERLNLR